MLSQSGQVYPFPILIPECWLQDQMVGETQSPLLCSFVREQDCRKPQFQDLSSSCLISARAAFAQILILFLIPVQFPISIYCFSSCPDKASQQDDLLMQWDARVARAPLVPVKTPFCSQNSSPEQVYLLPRLPNCSGLLFWEQKWCTVFTGTNGALAAIASHCISISSCA